MKEMFYSELTKVYDDLFATTKRLEKTAILAEFLKEISVEGRYEWVYLVVGKVLPDYDSREIGISRQIALKALSKGLGISEKEIESLFRKTGDLGEIAEILSEKKTQKGLFSSRLTVRKVFDNLKKIIDIEGKGAINKKLQLVSELLGNASPVEAKYIIRTVVSDLRIGVNAGTLRDSLALAFFSEDKNMVDEIQRAYDLTNDFAVVFEAASKGKKDLADVALKPGRPLNVMLAVKAENIEDAFKICGKPAALEYKYDGFRVVISKDKNEIKLFTRRLENVTKQFPDVVRAVKNQIKGDSFILDSEVVGYNAETGKYTPFQAISQRIRRKYDIDKLEKELPVEINVFDVLYLNGESLLDLAFKERRKVVMEIVKEKKKVIRPAVQIVTGDVEEAQEFYQKALDVGEEGVIIKNLNVPYKQGRRVGYIAKLKPSVKDLDLVIVGAEHGSGKRGGWLTSYIVACSSNGDFLEVGKVSSGLKEKSEEGTTYEEMTKILRKIIVNAKGNYVSVKPEVVVSVTYQDIQKSPSYSSGYALRFPRITAYRPDRNVDDISGIEDIKKFTE